MSIKSPVGSEGTNRAADVLLVQQLLNRYAASVGFDQRLAESGAVSDRMIRAIRLFQTKVVKLRDPDGRVDPNGRTMRLLEEAVRATAPPEGASAPALVATGPAPDLEAAPWMEIARKEIGVMELDGPAANHPRILEYLDSFPYLSDIEAKGLPGKSLADLDETAWCACFVNWCLVEAGKKAGKNAAAISWKDYGRALSGPRFGAITVIRKKGARDTTGTTSSGNHVAFLVEQRADGLLLLGGNQGNKVCQAPFGSAKWEQIAFRWPS